LANLSISDYFALKGPVPVAGPKGTGTRDQVYLFLGVLLGACAKIIYDHFASSADISWGQFLLVAIVSVVIFPQLYYSGGLDRRKLSFAHWTLAFQHGFFWSVAFAALSKKISG
jgi:hypothetical protein